MYFPLTESEQKFISNIFSGTLIQLNELNSKRKTFVTVQPSAELKYKKQRNFIFLRKNLSTVSLSNRTINYILIKILY